MSFWIIVVLNSAARSRNCKSEVREGVGSLTLNSMGRDKDILQFGL